MTGREPPRCPNVLLSVEPKHAAALLDGSKQFEYRRVVPARGPPMRLVLYATAPRKEAVGVVWSHDVRTGKPETVVDRTVRHTPSDRGDVLDYFEGVDEAHAIRVSSFRRFDEPVPRSELEADGIAPAQNFRYIGDVLAHAPKVEPAGVTVDV